MSLYEDLQNQNKQIEVLKTQLQRLEDDKKKTQQLIEFHEKQDGSDKINKLKIVNLIEDLQVKIDNYHFKKKLAIQVNFDVNKLSLIYNYKDKQLPLSTSDSTTLAQLEKWINFQSNMIDIYKILEDIKGDLRWVNSKYNEQRPYSNITFSLNSADTSRNSIKYTLKFTYPKVDTFNVEAKQYIQYGKNETYLSLNDKNLKAHIISSEVDSVDFDPRYDDPDDTFNIYLEINEHAIKPPLLKDIIEKTSKEIWDYEGFKTIYHD